MLINNIVQAPATLILNTEQNTTATAQVAGTLLLYNRTIHADADTFRASATFADFRKQYEEDLDKLAAHSDKHLPEIDAHRLKSQITTYKKHLFDSADHFSTKSEMMFSLARDAIIGIGELLESDKIPATEKSQNLAGR